MRHVSTFQVPPIFHQDGTTKPQPIVASLQEMLLPYTVHLSQDIYDNILVRHIENKGQHPTRGLVLQKCPKQNLLTIAVGDPQYEEHTSLP